MLSKMVLAVALLLAVQAAVAGPVNINTADAKLLAKELTGVGPSRAAAIVQYRTEKGPFKAPEEIKKVPGIGEAVFKENAPHIRIKD